MFLADLAKELAAFLKEPLAEAGGRETLAAVDTHITHSRYDHYPVTCQGMLLLTDIYALYNRARGSALVAPEELHTACESRLPKILLSLRG